MLFFDKGELIIFYHNIEEPATAKIMAVRTNTMVLNKTIEPMHSHRSRHRERPAWPPLDSHTLVGYWEIMV